MTFSYSSAEARAITLTQQKRDALYAVNRLLNSLKDEIRDTEPVGLELHMKTLQIIRLQNWRNAAYDEDGNWR